MQRLQWSGVTWDKDDGGTGLPETAQYGCEHCGGIWSEVDRHLAVKRGEWRATEPTNGRAGFHLSELYSPWSTLAEMVQGFLEAKKSPELLKTWVNTCLGETWEDREGESVDQTSLYSRREKYPAQVPEDALLLTAGIDVQHDRIEMEVVAWGEGEESWNVDYRVIPGDTAREDVWNDLDDVLSAQYEHQTGAQFLITAALIDSSDQTTTVYSYVKRSRHQRLFAGKGISGAGRPVAKVSRKLSGRKRRDVDLYQVGVDDAKGIIYARLKITEVGPGYCHFPIDRDLEYFEQLAGEKLVTRYHKGFAKKEWVKTRARNEALDCRVYAFAALKILNPVWSAIEKRANREQVKVEDPELPRATQRRRPARRKKNWATDI
jgi:phage terminase large subunit GpA-like protein